MKKRPPLAWVTLGLLIALVATNVVFLALLQAFGPLIGIVFYCVVMWRWHRCDYQGGIVGGGVGLLIHVVEVIIVGWTDYPLLMALNLVLPALLTLTSWLTSRRAE